jgi:cobalt-zinc-cadmium efflux system membrane fusion protein
MRKYILLPLIFVALPLFFWSCNKSDQSKQTEAKQEIKTCKVAIQEIQSYIEATGSVQADLEGTSKVMSHLAGSVSQILIKIGDRVKKSDPLLIVKSPDVTDIYSSYLSGLAQFKQAERVYGLNKQLFEIGAITKNDLLNSESAHEQWKAVTEGLRKKLNLYGCSPADTVHQGNLNCSDTVTVRAPIGGYIADTQVHVGDRVDQTTPLMTVADPQNIIIVANIYDTDAAKIKKGSNVIFNVDIFPETAFNGIISYVSDVSDSESKTVKTFIKITGKKDLFKHNMFLRLKIEEKKKSLPLIPQSAMVYKEGKFFVYVPKKDGITSLKEVKPVKEMPGKLMAVEGINGGDEIVLSAIEMERP